MTAPAKTDTPALRWAIFCKVIDNHGDLGVCWRLSRDLASRGHQVDLWVDQSQALRWMTPMGYPGVTVRPWTSPLDFQSNDVGDVLIEAFGCEPPAEFLAAWAKQATLHTNPGVWLNLEYLSAEAYVAKNHGLMSPVLSGPAKGLHKHFFYPGFTPQTGGLLREPDLHERQHPFVALHGLEGLGIVPRPQERLVSLFCYEPVALAAMLSLWAKDATPTRLLVTAGRAAHAVLAAQQQLQAQHPGWNAGGQLVLHSLPHLTQDDYDHLLWSCDLNFVRGEDSLVRALWAGRPFVWQIYPQEDLAHHDKLNAFLDMLKAPASVRRLHHIWNGVNAGDIGPLAWTDLADCAQSTRQRLLAQPDLTTRLLEFVAQQRQTAVAR
jgi:uncharacterized repeat protein (TIGR03837 family)